jgi:hypothetical protein
VQERRAATQAFLEILAEKEKRLKNKRVQGLEEGLVTNPTNLYEKRSTYLPPIMKAVASVALLQPYVTEEERNFIPPERVLFFFQPDSIVRRGKYPARRPFPSFFLISSHIAVCLSKCYC